MNEVCGHENHTENGYNLISLWCLIVGATTDNGALTLYSRRLTGVILGGSFLFAPIPLRP